jgi:PAS domain S-box-containing protein
MSGTVQDITERKQKEENLRLFRYLIDKSNDAITIVNSETGIILDANEKASSCLGYSRDELLKMHVYDFEVTLPDNFSWKQHVKEIKKKGSLFLEGKHKRKDGTIFPVEVSVKLHESGNKSRLVAVARDITEHKRIVEIVKESEERFHSITQSANDAIITADSKGDILFWNNSAQKLFGYRDEEVTGKHLTFLMPERYRDAHQKGMGRLLATGVPHVIGKTVELSGLRKDGSEFLIELSLSTWKTGDKVFYSGILRDITERKLAEEKIRKSLEEKEVLLREIHHRVKNNMQIVSSLLMLQSHNIEDKKYKEMFVDSQTRIFSMGLIHEKLYQSESIAQINFKEYINGIVSNIFESYGLRSNIKFDIKAENIPIKIDYAVPCGLIVNELVTNSLKYGFPDERQGKIQILLKSDTTTNNIQLSISDDGIGIPKELDIRNTKSLGLHLVTALAEGQLHGTIILNRDNGTEFQISFSAK